VLSVVADALADPVDHLVQYDGAKLVVGYWIKGVEGARIHVHPGIALARDPHSW
jgi:hypothetical protein